MGLSTADANYMLGARFGGSAATIPTSYLVGLSSTPPQDDGTGITEPTDSAYARVTIANNTTTWATPSGRLVTTAIQINFATPTADRTNIGYWFLLDAATPFRLCAAGRFAQAMTVPSGAQCFIAVGGISIRVPASTLQL